MTIVSYHSSLISNPASPEGGIGTTSSQILLSREVADHTSQHTSTDSQRPASVVSILESDRHVMTLADPAGNTTISATEGEKEATHIEHYGDDSSGVTKTGVCPDGGPPTAPKRRRLYRSIDPPPEIVNRHSALCYSASGTFCDGHRARRNHASHDGATDPSRTQRIIEKGSEVDRGRTWERGPRLEDPLARATSRTRSQEAAIEIDMRQIERRNHSRSSTFFEDPTVLEAKLEDEMLEPLPFPRPPARSMTEVSEEIFQQSSPDSQNTAPGSSPESTHSRTNTAPFFTTVWSTFSDTSRQAPQFNAAFNRHDLLDPMATIAPQYLTEKMPSFDSLKLPTSKSSSSRRSQTSDALTLKDIPTRHRPVAAELPTEILHCIFICLGPVDFNSARHSCRSWFVNSLERSLLETMLQRGGWSDSIQYGLSSNDISDAQVSDEWQMSKRISRECALGPDWTGTGIGEFTAEFTVDGSVVSGKSSMILTTEVDFTEVSVQFPKLKTLGIIFTMSSCGKFLMVANGCLIYIYELNQSHNTFGDCPVTEAGALKPVTSIICPRQVLACSMDTSSHRYAVAALLDGRMGLVCDITSKNLLHGSRPHNKPDNIIYSQSPGISTPTGQDESYQGASFLDRVSLNSSASHTPGSLSSTEPSFVLPGIATTSPHEKYHNSEDHNRGWGAWKDVSPARSQRSSRSSGGSQARTHAQSSKSSRIYPWTTSDTNTMPVENGTRSIYRNLCSDDDPPRSVAICPQRRCVAFGCSAGIELHWVDALTGQDLNRWFPLTAPSDYLFFLPPRKSVDSAKKLRLISSAARPGERPAIGVRAFGSSTRQSPFWQRLGWGLSNQESGGEARKGFFGRAGSVTLSRPESGWRDGSDHYRAIPVSDGYHILFTDPGTGLLCLGSDAPIGGPTKLLRKIWFKGPPDEGSPVCYATGSNLKHGVRVVAAYGVGDEQSVWLFSVPGDVFMAGSSPQSVLGGTHWVGPTSPREIQKMPWVEWWPDESTQDWLYHMQNPQPGIMPRSIWPIGVRGQKIGTCRGLVDLAIDSGPDMAVWALSKEGSAKVWRINDGRPNGVNRRLVVRDGTIRECDSDGNVEMPDAPTTSFSTETFDLQEDASPSSYNGITTAFFDGAASSSTSSFFNTESSIRGDAFDYDSDETNDAAGDVLMEDLPGMERYIDGNSHEEMDTMVMSAHHGGAIYYHSSRSSCSYRSRIVLEGNGRDLVEELTGIARIDIEIR